MIGMTMITSNRRLRPMFVRANTHAKEVPINRDSNVEAKAYTKVF